MAKKTSTYTDSKGVRHDLTTAPRLSVGEAAIKLKCSVKTVRRRLRQGQLGPVVRLSAADVQLYAVGVADFIARNTQEAAHA